LYRETLVGFAAAIFFRRVTRTCDAIANLAPLATSIIFRFSNP
jgi:hypothetical protein